MPYVVPVPATEQLIGVAQHAAADPDFSCVRQDAGAGEVRLAVSGELDVATAPEFDHALRGVQRRAVHVVVDLRGLTFMDCTGLRVLLEAIHRARASAARFRVVSGSPPVDRLLMLTDIDVQTQEHRRLAG